MLMLTVMTMAFTVTVVTRIVLRRSLYPVQAFVPLVLKRTV